MAISAAQLASSNNWFRAYPTLAGAISQGGIAEALVEELPSIGIEDLETENHPVLQWLDRLCRTTDNFETNQGGRPFRRFLKACFLERENMMGGNHSEQSALWINLALSNLKHQGLIKDFIYTDGPLRNHLAPNHFGNERLSFYDRLGIDVLVEVKAGKFFPLQLKSGKNDSSKVVDLPLNAKEIKTISDEVPDEDIYIKHMPTKGEQAFGLYIKRNIPVLGGILQKARDDFSVFSDELKSLIEDCDEELLLNFGEDVSKLKKEDIVLELYDTECLDFLSQHDLIGKSLRSEGFVLSREDEFDDVLVGVRNAFKHAQLGNSNNSALNAFFVNLIKKHPNLESESARGFMKKALDLLIFDKYDRSERLKLRAEYRAWKAKSRSNETLAILEKQRTMHDLRVKLCLAWLKDNAFIGDYKEVPISIFEKRYKEENNPGKACFAYMISEPAGEEYRAFVISPFDLRSKAKLKAEEKEKILKEQPSLDGKLAEGQSSTLKWLRIVTTDEFTLAEQLRNWAKKIAKTAAQV